MTKKTATPAQRAFNAYPKELIKDKAIALAKYIKERRESAVYSSWDQSLVAEQVIKADAMLKRDNPGHKDNPWMGYELDDVPNKGHKTLNTFGDDNRGLADGFSALTHAKIGEDDY